MRRSSRELTLTVTTKSSLQIEEAKLKAQSKVLRKELGIADLAFAQILIIIVPEFFGTAVKAGPSHVVLWLFAIVLFFIPHAFVVAHLNRLIPLEGGLYEWARLAFSDRVGFLVAWNIWLLQTIQVSQIALVTTTYVSYAAPRFAWIAASPRALVAASVVMIALMTILARYGLRIGKWVSNTGSIFTVLILTVLIFLPYVHAWRGHLPAYHPLPLVLPSVTLFSLSVFSRMTFGALSGFETVATFAGESHDPGRNIGRSILVTAPIIAALYILGTSGILAFVSPDAVDIIGPIPQALARGFAMFGVTGSLASVVILLLLTNYLCSYPLYFAANSRLPLVAGWDHLLPRWFTPLHPKYRTPVTNKPDAAKLCCAIANRLEPDAVTKGPVASYRYTAGAVALPVQDSGPTIGFSMPWPTVDPTADCQLIGKIGLPAVRSRVERAMSLPPPLRCVSRERSNAI